MSSLSDILNNKTTSIFHGEVVELKNNLYKVQIGSNVVYASLAISESLYEGQRVILGKSTGMYFIIGIGRATNKEPTLIKIRG